MLVARREVSTDKKTNEPGRSGTLTNPCRPHGPEPGISDVEGRSGRDVREVCPGLMSQDHQ